MERRIRRLGIALVLLFAVAVRTARVRAGLRGRRHQEQPRELQPPADRRIQRPAREDPLRRRTRARRERAGPQGLSVSLRTTVSAGRPLRIHHRLLLEDLRPVRARAVDELLPVGRGAGARALHVHRPLPGPGEARRQHLRDRSIRTCRRWHAPPSARNEGAVVAMDPRTGDILALYSTPGFDPSELSSGSDAEMRQRVEATERRPGQAAPRSVSPGTLPPRFEFQDRDGVGGDSRTDSVRRACGRIRTGSRCRSRTSSSRTSATTTATEVRRRSR